MSISSRPHGVRDAVLRQQRLFVGGPERLHVSGANTDACIDPCAADEGNEEDALRFDEVKADSDAVTEPE